MWYRKMVGGDQSWVVLSLGYLVLSLCLMVSSLKVAVTLLWHAWPWFSRFSFTNSCQIVLLGRSGTPVGILTNHKYTPSLHYLTLFLHFLSVAHKSDIFHFSLNRPQFNRERTRMWNPPFHHLHTDSIKFTLLDISSVISDSLTDILSFWLMLNTGSNEHT